MSRAFRLASYNILANSYIKPQWYPQVVPAHLDWETRKVALARHIRDFDADILCLQEVEEEAYAFLEQSLAADGYAGVYAPKGQKKPDGCATFFRRQGLQFQSSQTLYYHDGADAPDSGHLALIVSFAYEGRSLHVANTHLKWDREDKPAETHWGRRQIRELLTDPVGGSDSTDAWVISGDFNAQFDSPLVQEILTSGLQDAYRGHEQATCNSNRKAKRIDYLFHTAHLIAQPEAIREIDDLTPLPSEVEPSDHLAILAQFRFM